MEGTHKSYGQSISTMDSIIFSKTAKVMINGHAAIIHESAFKKAAIFSPLIDCADDLADKTLEITLDTNKYLGKILDLLYYDDECLFLKDVDNAKDMLEVVALMTQMGFDTKILKSCINQMTNINIFNTIKDIGILDNSFRLFVDNINVELPNGQIKSIASGLQEHTNIIATTRLITKLLCGGEKRKKYDFITMINASEYRANENGRMREAFSYLQNVSDSDIGNRDWNGLIVSKYMKQKPTLVHRAIDNIIRITSLEIGGKPIPLYDHIKTSTPGTAGGNTMLSYAMFVAKELLGLDPYVDYEAGI